jgi:hypothetical protein
MNQDEVVAFLHTVSYKPGDRYKLEVTPDDNGSVAFTLHTYTPDALRVGHPTTHVPVTYRLWPPFEAGVVSSLLRQHVFHRFECHEADEWFMIDGKAPFHPHPSERPR